MKTVLGVLKSKWFVTLIAALALCVIIWFIGPLVAIAELRPLDGVLARLIVVLVILVVWAAYNLLRRVKAGRTDKAMVSDIAEAGTAGGAAEASGEIAVLRQRLEEALGLLRKSSGEGGGRRYLYQLPWYMLIGPPGAGKTTALQNSGLNFPLAQRYGKDPVRGVGGTRNCDWWFTDDAVLLDTAGRYTTQDSHQAADEAAWRGFLGLLKKFRPRQPLNGALVAISIGDIAGLPPAERLAHARAIRERLKELHDEFAVRLPVYVLFTKADLIAGFVEYFDDLGREEREQVWGATLPLAEGKEAGEPAVAAAGAEFNALIDRLNLRLLDRLQQETDIGRRTQIWGFPGQVASLKEPIVDFLNEVFAPNRYEEPALLRGFYFTSGTQEGTPIDRVISGMAAAFGVDRQRVAAFSGAGRSYFLTRLLRQVVFAEASVVSANPRLERRRAWLRRLAYAGSVAALLACVGAWTASYIANRTLIDKVGNELAVYEQAVAPFAVPVVSDEDLAGVLPALDALRNIPTGFAAADDPVPLIETFGLYQGDKLGPAASKAYLEALNKVFRPRLLVHLGNQIRRRVNDADYVQQGLKAYLMLGGAAPNFDAGFLQRAFAYAWEASFPGRERAPLRDGLAAHLAALLRIKLEPLTLDQQVIDSGRATLQRSPMASRVYLVIKQSDEARQLPEWRVGDHAGPAADRVLVRQGGTLASGVPGFYTYDGFQRVFLRQLGKAAATMASESWVLGSAAPPTNASRLEGEVASLYLADYNAQWDRLLGEVGIAPFRGVREAADALNILSGPTSPLKLFYGSVAAETNLTRPPDGVAGVAQGLEKAAAGALQGAAPDQLKKVMGGALPGAAQPAYGKVVEDHFKWLQDYVGVGGKGPAPIDDTIRGLNDAYLQLNGIAQGGAPAPGARPSGGALDTLKTMASRVPPRIGGILTQIQSNATSLTTGGLRERIRDEWASNVFGFCQKALNGRYPISRTSADDATLDDFTRLFAPNGLIDRFFTTELKPFADTSKQPWRWQKLGDVDLGLSADVLVQFQRAAAIRDGFFPGGSATPLLKLELTPDYLDAKSTQVLIEVDGQSIAYKHDPPRPALLQWPGQGAAQGGRVSFSPPDAGRPAAISKVGPWALFRLFDEAKIEEGGLPDRVRVTFEIGGRKATYDIRASSVINPLGLRELGEFRCPKL